MLTYSEQDSLIHLLDPRIKLLYCLVISLLAVIVDNYVVLSSLFLFVILCWVLSKPNVSKIKLLSVLTVTIVISASLSQSVFYGGAPRTAILTILPEDFPLIGRLTGGIFVYYEGFLHGMKQSLRFLVVVYAGLLTMRTTHTSDFVLGLVYFKVPQSFSFMLTVALRSIPLLTSRMKRILLAQQMRGMKIEGVIGAFKSCKNLLVPLMINTLRDTRQLGLAAEVRGYTGNRTFFRELQFSIADHVSLVILAMLFLVSIIISLATSSLNFGELY